MVNGRPKKSIKIKNKLFRIKDRTGQKDDMQKYKLYRNKLNNILREAERNHYDQLLRENKGNIKNMLENY